MTASGVKFGKTEAGAVWLDAELTSPYRFYQYWLSTDDLDVVKYLKYFTWLDRAAIEELEAAHAQAPEGRQAHRTLAREVTELVHGPTALERAELSSRVLFGAEIEDLEARDIREVFDDVPSTEIPRSALDGAGLALTELMVKSGLVPSKGAAKRLIRDGGAYVNNRRISDEHAVVTAGELLDGSLLVLRKGQKHYHLVSLGRAS
jgi:tyrosyl-tRNA synthetase